jgi:tetratricopeptide (TPR) repeat protein
MSSVGPKRQIGNRGQGEFMGLSYKSVLALSFITLVLAFGVQAAPAPQGHPAYLHALSDLRDARAHLERPNHGELRQQEKDAIKEIDKAIDEIKKASIDDGKDISDHVPVDAHLPWDGRLHKALDLLDKAHNDIAKEEDDRFAVGLQQRAMDHIDKAHKHVEEAIAIVR